MKSDEKYLFKTVVVTGATGYIGSRLARRLVAERRDVHLLIRRRSNSNNIRTILDRVHLHYCDTGLDDILSCLSKVHPDIIFHLAAASNNGRTQTEIDTLLTSNIAFGTYLLEAMRMSGSSRLINTGTFWAHYNNEPYNPVNLYAATKKGFQDIMCYYIEAAKLCAATLELFDVYGPADNRGKILSLLQHCLQSQQTLSMSPGEQLIDLVHIDDVIDAYLLAAQQLMKTESAQESCYGLSSGAPLSLRELVRICEKICGKKLKICWGGRPYREREVMIPWRDFKSLPGWQAKISLEEGIQSLCNNTDHLFAKKNSAR